MKFIIFSSLLSLFCVGAFAADAHKLSVTGNSSIFKPADQLNIIIGVETFDQESKKAAQANAAKMQAVKDVLIKTGLSEKEIQTKEFTIAPVLTPPPQNPPADWQPKIAGYQVRNTYQVKTKRLDLAGTIIDATTKEGANTIQSISFTLENEDIAKVEAIGQAYKQAEFYATALSKEAHVKLGDIIELSISHPFTNVRFLKAERFSQELGTPISPKDVEVKASVSVVFEIDKLQP